MTLKEVATELKNGNTVLVWQEDYNLCGRVLKNYDTETDTINNTTDETFLNNVEFVDPFYMIITSDRIDNEYDACSQVVWLYQTFRRQAIRAVKELRRK